MDTFQCEPFGTVTIRRRHDARSIRIRIKTDGLLVSADYYTSDKQILKLIEQNREAILKEQQSLKSKKKLINEDFRLRNRYFSLSIRRDDAIKRLLFTIKAESSVMPYKFTMRCNSKADLTDEETQEHMLNAINKLIRNVANEPLRERTMQLAKEFGFEVNSVKTKIEKSKWGSCSSRKNINLSAYLIFLPEHIRDFVIIHELCHLKEMNHSSRFHDLVNKYTGGKEKEFEKELKKYSSNIFDYTAEADVK